MNTYTTLTKETLTKLQEEATPKEGVNWWGVTKILGKENIAFYFETLAKVSHISLGEIQYSYIKHELENIDGMEFCIWGGYRIDDPIVLNEFSRIAESANVSLWKVENIWSKVVKEMATIAEEQRAEAAAVHMEQEIEYYSAA